MNKEKVKSKQNNNIILIISAILAIVLLYNAFITSNINSEIDNKIKISEELNQPGDIEIILIGAKDCAYCETLEEQILKLETSSLIKVLTKTEFDITTDEGKKSASKYEITKVPAIIITGETDKRQDIVNLIESVGGVFDADMNAIVEPILPIYYDSLNSKIVGDIKATIITDKTCDTCSSIDPFIAQITSGGIQIVDTLEIDKSDARATEIISKYNIDKLPTVVFSSDLGEYEGMGTLWESIGSVETDGSFVLRNVTAPYYDISYGQVVGLVRVVGLSDESCTECYDVKVHEEIITSMGVTMSEWIDLDVSTDDGKAYIEKYNITSIPTILLSRDSKYYPALVSVWSNVGSVEDDGMLVFRQNDVMSGMAYKNLLTGEIINQ